MFRKRLITNAIFLSIVFSGQIEFESFNIEDGLSQNTVYEIKFIFRVWENNLAVEQNEI